MIEIRTELHEIENLTEPMFTACSVECPAMVGAPCPADKGKTCPGWSAKFGNAAAEVVHGWTLDSNQDETTGDTDRGGWFALFRTPADEVSDDNPMRAGVILSTNSQGFVGVYRYDTEADLTKNWDVLVAEYGGDEDED